MCINYFLYEVNVLPPQTRRAPHLPGSIRHVLQGKTLVLDHRNPTKSWLYPSRGAKCVCPSVSPSIKWDHNSFDHLGLLRRQSELICALRVRQSVDIVLWWGVDFFQGPGILSLWVLPGPQGSQVAEPAVSLSPLAPRNFLASLPTPTSQHRNNPILLDY